MRKMASNERINYKLIAPDRWRKVQFGVGAGYDCVGYAEKVRDQPEREQRLTPHWRRSKAVPPN